MFRGKKYKNSKEKLSKKENYNLEEALSTLTETATAKFDESVDVALKLGVDPRHADQMIRGTLVLPHGTGKSISVLVFAKGDKEKEAQEAGADHVGGEDLAQKIQGGWLGFDKAVATPDMMSVVGKLGRILGPRGMMPTPKTGTVTFDVGQAVGDIKAGKVDFRVDKAGILHVPMGRVSFGAEKLLENIHAFLEEVVKLKPSSSKGQYFRGFSVSSTMSPGIKVDIGLIQKQLRI
jgi:large subunit ribosomal protein L1